MRKHRTIRVISTTQYNAFVRHFFRKRIVDVDGGEVEPWRHPWFSQVTWQGSSERFAVSVRPGACPSGTSDGDPMMKTEAQFASAETLRRLGKEEATPTESVEAFLSESPKMPVPVSQLRKIGTDAVGFGENVPEAVPAFFSKRGVVGANVVIDRGGSLVTQVSGVAEDRSEARLLRACDLLLTHERLVTASTVTEGVSGITVELSLQPSPNGLRDPYISIVPRFADQVAYETIPLVSGEQTDPGKDSIHIATLYFLSPEGAEEGSDPDNTWQPFVKHHVRWNLQYVTRQMVVPIEPTRLEVPLPTLGTGELGRIGGRIVGALNDNLAEVESAVQRVGNQGRFLMM